MKRLFVIFLATILVLCLFSCDEKKTESEVGSSEGQSVSSSTENDVPRDPVTAISARVSTFIPIGNNEFIDGYIEINTDNTLTFYGRRFKLINRNTVTDEEIEKINASLFSDTGYLDEEGTSLFAWSQWGQGTFGTAPDEYRVETFEDFFTKDQEFSCGDYVAIPSYVFNDGYGFIASSLAISYTYDEATDVITVIGCNDLESIIFGEDTVIVSHGKVIAECESFNGNAFKAFIEALGL